eukprot:4761803-Amphidinium_carterae.1
MPEEIAKIPKRPPPSYGHDMRLQTASLLEDPTSCTSLFGSMADANHTGMCKLRNLNCFPDLQHHVT